MNSFLGEPTVICHREDRRQFFTIKNSQIDRYFLAFFRTVGTHASMIEFANASARFASGRRATDLSDGQEKRVKDLQRCPQLIEIIREWLRQTAI
ncbi:MAG: hypothetical protein KGK16_02300 [Bradyrhizobium sp.]|nr:hypothetical protein [Bradyrhizobium sp.]